MLGKRNFIKSSWHLPDNTATSESVFFNRREIVKGLGLGGITMAAAANPMGKFALAEEDPSASLYPVPRNEAYTLERPVTPEPINTKYNNFYEFGSHKQIYAAAQALKVRPWEILIDGEVEKPITIGFDDLLKKMPLEERLYRHRCVEAWSMRVPWSGFQMSNLIEMAKPTSDARYVRFETFGDPSVAPGQKQFWYPWPYVEGITIEEAMNEMTFMVTGAYGKPVPKQMGAPLRLALPWKYGFKSIKSVKKISFTKDRPVSFWEELGPKEYGFWANVNPEVDHPRWSQATERDLETGKRIPTQLYNGYGEQVASLYEGLEGESLFM
ncbi:MAG: protein-methionine-sulfoxide reductase catalytic subunit MsrP [Rhizobiaceae bacterium]